MLDESSHSNTSRSSSAIAMGDTKSIVLALQTLQEKIRKLEADRNFHQDQCERARAGHEEYKRDIEMQLDRERKEHRRREAELQDLINRANQERNTLQSTLEESRRDIGAFRSELETLLERERKDATKRDEKLQTELTQLHAELARERKNAEAAAETVKSLKEEKETIESTNRRLEETIQEMVVMNNSLIATSQKNTSSRRSGNTATATATATATYQQQQQQQQHNVSSSAAVHHRDPMMTATDNGGRGGWVPPPGRASSAHNRSSSSAHNTSASRLMGHYALHNSQLKCVRHESHNTSFDTKQTIVRGRSTTRSATPPNRTRSSGGAPAPAPTASGHNMSQVGGMKVDERIEALDELYAELQSEHETLNQKYSQVVRRASDPDEQGRILSPGQLTAELNSIMSKIDRKTEQMQMVRQSRNKLEKEGRTGGTAKAPRQPKGFDKATRKAALMNELRGLFNRTLNQ